MAGWLEETIPNMQVVALIIGLLSAIVDNVPLVAAGIKMYEFPTDHSFWLFLAYCAGTGGSCLIIGSAAGVAAMGLEKIDFIWYIRRVSFYALIGYLGGAGVFVIQESIFPHESGPATAIAAPEHGSGEPHSTEEPAEAAAH